MNIPIGNEDIYSYRDNMYIYTLFFTFPKDSHYNLISNTGILQGFPLQVDIKYCRNAPGHYAPRPVHRSLEVRCGAVWRHGRAARQGAVRSKSLGLFGVPGCGAAHP